MTTHSILIPTFNRPSLLRRAVTSAISAAGNTGEIIVVDDASDTPAEEVLSDIRFDRLQVLRNPRPMTGGGSPSRNRGADAAVGQVLFFLDDDDVFLDGYCGKILSDEVQNVADFGFSARLFTTSEGNSAADAKKEIRALQNGAIPQTANFKDKAIPFSAGFWMKRQTFQAIGPMVTELRTNSDTEYCCRLYASDKTGWYSEEPGVLVYQENQPLGETRSVTERTRSADRADAFSYMAQANANFLSRDASAAQFVFARLLKHSYRAGRMQDAASAAFNYANASIRRMALKS